MQFHFLRHGESEANVLHIFSNRGWQHGLTAAGRAQATALADRLAGADIDVFYSSPLRRAVETATILSESLGLRYEVTDSLREYDCGVIENTGGDEASRLFKQVLEDWVLRHEWDSRIEGGESFNDMKARFVPFVQEQIKRASSGGPTPAFVAHGGILRCMLPLVLDNIDLEFAMAHRVGYAGAIVTRARSGRLLCLDWAGHPVAQPETSSEA